MTLGRVAQYELLERLGEGGMGEVFRAMDTMLEREVAIKALRPALAAREDLVERFRVEAIALARLNHPNIATVYSFLQDQGTYFMVMLFVRGLTLEQVLAQRTRLPWNEALGVVAQTLRALEHAHAQGVVHRDLKPANLMIRADGSVVVMDFGIARVLARARQTRSGNLVGTLEYISPEQIQGREVDGRADFYSLGVMLYEMLTGRLPFVASTEFDLLRAHVEATPPPARDLCADVPPDVEALVSRAMAKDPRQRFANATEFLRTVESMLPDAGVRPQGPVAATSGAGWFTRARERAADLAGRITPVDGPGGRGKATGPLPGSTPAPAAAGNWRDSLVGFAKSNPGIAAAAVLGLIAAALAIAGALSTPKPLPPAPPPPPSPLSVVPPAPEPPPNPASKTALPGITIADERPEPVAPFPKSGEAPRTPPAQSPAPPSEPPRKDPARPAEREAAPSKPASGWYVR